jgi:hypothetical protein
MIDSLVREVNGVVMENAKGNETGSSVGVLAGLGLALAVGGGWFTLFPALWIGSAVGAHLEKNYKEEMKKRGN